ncbi:MAG: hypothetical protein AABY22_10390 [Nanoarchaeota archaeon]
MNEQIIINKNENADSIEWRLETGKSIKVYGDSNNPEEFKKKVNTAIQILKEIDKNENITSK